MATHEFPERPGRETRLLLLVVAVSIAVLLLLARLRFPSADLTAVPPGPEPLAGLARRATFDDLGETMRALLGQVSPRLVTVEFAAAAPLAARRDLPSTDTSAQDPPPPGTSERPDASSRPMLALRVRTGFALVYVPPGWQPRWLAETGDLAEIAAADPTRHLALLRIPAATEFRAEAPVDGFSGLSFVGALDATRVGPTIHPLFLGRVSTAGDDRWPGPLYALTNAVGLSPGMFVFSIEGRLVGLAIREGDRDLLVPASVLDAVVTELGADGPVGP